MVSLKLPAPFLLPLDSPAATLAVAGGKAANLARLFRAGFPVPGGFIITTAAYEAFVAANELEPAIQTALATCVADDPAALEAASATIRSRFVAATLPAKLSAALRAAYLNLEIASVAVAVRSSATAEDLPGFSFAGQQDTFLNVVGEEELLRAVVDCWSSLWTGRAIGYRSRNGISHNNIGLAVVVQAMIQSEAAGVLFTANPVTGKRTESVIDATLGLGEALVAGQVEPDHYVVDAAGQIASKTLGAKALAVRGQAGGGTVAQAEDAATCQAVPDAAIVELAGLGRQVEALLGAEQDIEWAWADGKVWLLQARPITSLYPLPPAASVAPSLRVYFSFGALQGFLTPITPLGRDMLYDAIAAVIAQFTRPGAGAPHTAPLHTAGERLFIDLTTAMRHSQFRRLTRAIPPVVEPGSAAVLVPLWDDPALAADGRRLSFTTMRRLIPLLLPVARRFAANLLSPDRGRQRVQQRIEEVLAAFTAHAQAADVSQKSLATTYPENGAHLARVLTLFDQMVTDLPGMILPYLLPVFAPGMATLNLLDHLAATTPGGSDTALEITRGMPHNVTTEMDLALWQTAQTIRRDPAAAAAFTGTDAAALAADCLAGRLPPTAQAAIGDFLARYGMRGVGEIDIGRPRWREDPAPVLQAVSSYLRINDPDRAPDAVFRRGAAASQAALARLTADLRRTRGGWLKARLARWAARRVRALAGLRETPKFTIIRFFGILRQGLLACGQELAAAGLLTQADDIFFLRMAELRTLAVQPSSTDWRGLVAERRATFALEERRKQVPRILLSDGRAFYEGVGGPAADGLVGSPVSPGMVEGPVRVVLDPRGAQLAPGDILVCPGTDPSWTPLFLAAGGLVMEVGGLMTHGAVVAREYGIPAVVGVSHATTRLVTGQRVRVDGSTGQIVIL